MNSLYIVLLGSASCFANDFKTQSYVRELVSAQNAAQRRVSRVENELLCLDDEINEVGQEKETLLDVKAKLTVVKSYVYGDWFGGINSFQE